MLATDRSRARSLVHALPLLLVALGVGRYAVARASSLVLANHDVAWLLHAGGVWLDGGRIGVDIVDPNPPLVIWLCGLEVLVARALGAAPLLVHAIVSTAIGLLCVWLATRAFARAGVPRVALALWAPLVLVAATAAAGYDFGQRDHWLALLLLPYAGWALVPRQVSLERGLAGVLAALAIALKPHHVLAVLVVELFGMLRARSVRQLVRLETLIAPACALAYVLAISWSSPSYWTDARDALSVYAAYDRPVPLWSTHTRLLLAALVLAAPLGWLRPRTLAPCLLAALSLSGWISVHVQHKNFAYHYVPSEIFASAALALAFLLLVVRLVSWSWMTLVIDLVVTVGCLATLQSLPLAPRDRQARIAQRDYFQLLAGDDTLFVFSASVGRLFPAVSFTTARSISPYGGLWAIAGNYTPEERAAQPFVYRALGEMPPVERRLVERVVGVLVRERPRLLVFDRRPFQQAFGHTSFDFQRYFEVHPDFVALLGSYERLAQDPDFEYYGRRRE